MTEFYEGTTKSGLSAVFSNLKSFPRDSSLGTLISGFLVVLVAVTGPIVIQLTAAKNGSFTDAQTSNWIFITWFTSGLFWVVSKFAFSYANDRITFYCIYGSIGNKPADTLNQ